MPHKSSNIPSKMFNSTIIAEFLRVSKASTTYCVFLKSVQLLIKRMIKQGASIHSLKYSLRKMLNNHVEIKTKFDKENNNIITDIVNICIGMMWAELTHHFNIFS